MITIEGKTFGSRQALFPSWSIPLDDDAGLPATLRELIARVVAEEVAAFKERREQRRVIHALTARQISDGVERGKIDSGGREEPEGDVDSAAATAVALQAFEDGLYYVFIDDVQIERLDNRLALDTGSRITFLRLVALAGG
ncbi:MAG: hypothetical protein ACLQVD_10960 [Capsulimonadaceae bacterium]